MHFCCIKGCLGAKLCNFVVLGAVWEPNSTFCCIRGYLGAKFFIFTILGDVCL